MKNFKIRVLLCARMSDAQKTVLVWAALIASVALCIAGVIGYQYFQDHRYKPVPAKTPTITTSSETGTTQTSPPTETLTAKVSCKDVTSIDYNWNNDVLCTRLDGSTFYTDYAGGYAADPDFTRN
jgi:hypothetical protein